MSEMSTLYMRVRLTEKSLETFKNSPLVLPNDYNDWSAWLASKGLEGTISDAEIQNIVPRYAQARSVGEYLSFMLQDIYAGPAKSQYDSASNTWTFCVMQYSENYLDFMVILSILRAIEQYKDLPGEDFILIYPYFWAGEADAYLTISAGSSRLVSQVPAEAIGEAQLMMQAWANEVFGSNEDDV